MYITIADDYLGGVRPMPLGRQGENFARCLHFSISELISQFGMGNVVWVVQRPGDPAPYIAQNTQVVYDTAILTLSDTETAIEGFGKMELRYYVGEVLCKTLVWTTEVTSSLMQTGDVPNPYTDILDDIAGYAKEAKDAAEEAESLLDDFADGGRADENGYLYLTNKGVDIAGPIGPFAGTGGAVYQDTVAGWNAQRDLISERDAIYVYTDFKTIDNGDGTFTIVPGIKIGDGTSYLIDQAFANGDDPRWVQHIANNTIHVTAAEKDFWNNKWRGYIDGGAPENLVFTTN